MRNIIILILFLLYGFGNVSIAADSLSEIDPVTQSDTSAIRTMSIHKTGFFSKKVTIIKYRAADGKIISVEVNGKFLPEKDFDKYEKMVQESTEYFAFSALEPEYEDVVQLLDNPQVSNIDKLEAIDELDRKLKLEKVSDESIMKSHLDILRSTVSSEILRENIQEILKQSDIGWDEEVMTAEFKKGICTINRKRLSKELSAKIYSIYEKHNNRSVEKDETIMYYF